MAAASMAMRFWLAWHSPVAWDLKGWLDVLARFRKGLPIYEGTHLYNWSPLWLWILRALWGLSGALGVPVEALIRSTLALSDGVSGLLLFRLAARTRGALAPWSALALYLANPVTVLIASSEAKFDTLSLVFLLGALALATDRVRSGARTAATALSLALSVAVKQITFFHPILWWRGRRSLALVAAPYGVFLLLFLPYASQWRGIRDHVLLYRSIPNSFGFAEWALADQRWAAPLHLFVVGTAILAAWLLRKIERARACLILFLVILVLTPGFGEHYVIWPLTVGALFGGYGYVLVSLSWLLVILGENRGLAGIHRWGLHIIWLSLILWAFEQLRAARRELNGKARSEVREGRGPGPRELGEPRAPDPGTAKL